MAEWISPCKTLLGLTLRCGLLVCVCRVQLRKLIQDEDGSVTAASDQLQHLIRLAAVDKDKVRHQHGRPC